MYQSKYLSPSDLQGRAVRVTIAKVTLEEMYNRQQNTKESQRLRWSVSMKGKIHPKYYEDAQVVCSCGNSFTTGSTKKLLKVEVCSNCHPFYTGERSRLLDSAGRVERFKQRYGYDTKK